MRSACSVLLASAAVGSLASALVAADPASNTLESAGTIDAVTVYRGQALVSRTVQLDGPLGLREVVVPELPEFLIPASLYAESANGVEVRSVSYRVRPLSEDSREEVRTLEESKQAVQDKINAVKARQQYLEWYRQYLDKLETFLSATAQVESGRGVLNANTIAEMTEFIVSQRRVQTEEGQRLVIEQRGLAEELGLIERELQNRTVRSSRTAREAVIFVNVTAANARLRLNYLVDRANWTPSYNLRTAAMPGGANADGAVDVEYQASIQQMSGEDWSNVAITLSTATPLLVASAPTLDPMTIALAAPNTQEAQQMAAFNSRGYADVKKELAFKQKDAENFRNLTGNNPVLGQTREMAQTAQSFSPNAFNFVNPDTDKGLNDVALDCQMLDFATAGNVDNRSSGEQMKMVAADESVSVTYTIPSRTSLPSRADQQLLQIATIEAPATFAKVATPLLTSYVYDQAMVTDSSSLVLLSGPSASYRNGEFVGRGTVPTVTAGETFVAGFGIDTSLRTSRELLERTETIQGGNRVVELLYRLSVENFSKSPQSIRLIDRIPNPRGTDIKVTLLSTGAADQPLSKDPSYERNERKTGLLRWDITVPGNAIGTDACTLEYRFRLEYDKQMSIAAGGVG